MSLGFVCLNTGPQLLVVFWKAVELLGDRAYLEERGFWGVGFGVYNGLARCPPFWLVCWNVSTLPSCFSTMPNYHIPQTMNQNESFPSSSLFQITYDSKRWLMPGYQGADGPGTAVCCESTERLKWNLQWRALQDENHGRPRFIHGVHNSQPWGFLVLFSNK